MGRQRRARHRHEDAVRRRVVGAEQTEEEGDRGPPGTGEGEDDVGAGEQHVPGEEHWRPANAVRQPPEGDGEEQVDERRADEEEHFDLPTIAGDKSDLFSCVIPEEDPDPDTPILADGTFTDDCGTPSAPFVITFVAETHGIDEDIMAIDFPNREVEEP